MPVPSTGTNAVITKDFREAYTGDFIVTAIQEYNSLYGGRQTDTFTEVRVNFSYDISDTVEYYTQANINSRLPVLKMTIIDNAFQDSSKYLSNHDWGMQDSTDGKLIYSYENRIGIASIANDGGYVGTDSINFSYHYTDPRSSYRYVIWGKRLK